MRDRRARRFVAAALALVLVTSGLVAWAFWTAPGVGSAAATSGWLDAAAISVPASGFNSLTVTWTQQASLQPDPADDSAITYSVERKLGSGSWAAVSSGGCSGAQSHGVTSCVDTPPVTGSYRYRVVATYHTWTETSSEVGPVAVAVGTDTAPPTNAITLSGVTGGAFKSGATVYYHGSAAGSFTLTNALTDSGISGPASSATAALSGTSTGWTHSPSLVSTPNGGPYVSSAFSWSAATTSSPSETITGSDMAGNTAATVLTFTNDSAAPTGGTVDATGLVGTGGRYSTSTGLSIAFSPGTDAASGLATGAQLQRASASLTSGSCGSYGAYTQVGADDPASPVADTVPAGQLCYRYRYVVLDRVGNQATYTSPDIKIDTTAPAAPTFAFSAFTNTYWSGSTLYYRRNASSGSFTVTASATDASSGIASYAFPTLGTGWTATPGALGVNTYSWSSANPTAPSGAQNATATNNATLTSAAAGFTMASDITAPATGTVTYTDGYFTSNSVSVSFTTGTDGGSGINATSGLLQRREATLTATCGAYGAYATVAGGTNPTSPFADTSVVSGKCYQYRYRVSDNVGNQATYTSANVAKVDSTPATISRSAAAKSVGSTPAVVRQGAAYNLYAQVTDTTGVSTVTATVSSFDTGVTATPLTTAGGPWTVGGQSYNYRSTAALTANTGLTTGASYSYTVTATDAASNTTGPASYSATIETYDSVIDATTGLVSYWRFNDGAIGGDEFTDTAGTVLSSHTGQVGATWTAVSGQARTGVISNANRLRKETGTGGAQYYDSGTPASANYLVRSDVYVASKLATDEIAVVGRQDVSGTGQTYYMARHVVSSNRWELARVVAGTTTLIGTGTGTGFYTQSLTVGSTYQMTLRMNGSAIALLVDGVSRITATDSTITAVGRGGVRLGAAASTALVSDSAGLHLDNFRTSSLTTTATDSKGTNNGTFANGPWLNEAGALAGDSDRAARLDGTNDYVTVPDAASLDLGDGPVTLEAWVRRNNTSAISAMVFFDKGNSAIEFAWEASNTVLVKNGVAYIGSWATTVNNTTWHHLVATRTTTAANLYVDGVNVTGTITPQALVNTALPLVMGAQQGSSAFLAATMDEFAYYNVALSAATVLDHYRAGTGTG